MIRKNANFKLLSVTLTAAVLLPLFNTLLLGSLSIYFGSDIAYPLLLSSILSRVSELLNIAAVFAGLACLYCAWGRPASRGAVTLIAFIGVPLTYLAAAAVDAGFYGSKTVNADYLLYSLPNCLFELARLAVVLLIVRSIAKNRERPRELELFSLGGTYSRMLSLGTLAVLVSMLLANAVETATLLLQYGAPVNSSELFTLVSPYVSALVFCVLGYFLGYLLLRRLSSERA